jgi:hypothetical protein
VKILENLSLRGVIWPGACAAAIKDLQDALYRKTVDRSSSYQIQSVVTGYRATTPLALDMAVQDQKAKTGSSGTDSISGPSVTTTQADSEFAHHSATADFQQGFEKLGNEANLETSLRQTTPLVSHSVMPQVDFESGSSYAYPDMIGLFPVVDQHIDDFDDIFQLMDVPYHLTEQKFNQWN